MYHNVAPEFARAVELHKGKLVIMISGNIPATSM
jgi:hypothetical protein